MLTFYLAALRSRVHRYRRYGLLPQACGTLCVRTERGSGLACALCGETMLASEPEVVVECERIPGLGTEQPSLRLHHLCHVIWLTESLPRRTAAVTPERRPRRAR